MEFIMMIFIRHHLLFKTIIILYFPFVSFGFYCSDNSSTEDFKVFYYRLSVRYKLRVLPARLRLDHGALY